MVITDATLYLPISNQTLRKILDDSQALESVVSGISVPQIASLIVLQYLPKLREKSSVSPERILSEAINSGNIHMDREGLPGVIADALTKLSRENLQEGYQLLSDFGIVLLDEETLKNRNYLTVEGNWDYGFRERHKTKLMDHLIQVDFYSNEIRALTAEQSRIYREVKAQADDHMHVQGYAGTGKSSLIKSLLMMLEPTGARILILAERKQQLDALLAGINQGKHVTAKTFGALAYEIIPSDLTSSKNQRLRRLDKSQAPISDAELIRRLGIHANGAFSTLNIIVSTN
jgi:hypothetical protein